MSRTPRTLDDFVAALTELDDPVMPATRWEHRYHEVEARLRQSDLDSTLRGADVLDLRERLSELWRRIHAPRLGT